MRPCNSNPIPAQTVLGNVNSSAISTTQVFAGSAQLVATGTASGTIQTQISNDNISPVNWADLDSAVSVSGAGSYLVPKKNISYQWIRYTYTNSASIAAASLTIQDILYTAVDLGLPGNSITLEYVDPMAPNIPLSVAVNGTDIVVTLATDAVVQSYVTIQDILYTANTNYVGTAGDVINLTYIDPGSPGASLSVGVVGDDITVNLATSPEVAASLAYQDITYTAQIAGSLGNSITIEYVGDVVAGMESVDVTGTDILVHMDNTTITGSTAQAIYDVMILSIPAMVLINPVITGNPLTVQGSESQEPLINGDDGGALISTAQDIADYIINVNGSGLVTPTITGTPSNIQTAELQAFLGNGYDGGVITSTATDVEAIINMTSAASDLVTPSITGTPSNLQTAEPQAPLSGGTDGGIISLQVKTLGF